MSETTAASGVTKHNESYAFIDPSKYAGKLSGKVVLVPGGSTGIGRAVSKAFAAAGAHVTIVSRSEANLAEARKEVQSVAALSSKVITIIGDVADAAVAEKAVAQTLQQTGASGIDILVNAAGVQHLEPFRSETPDLSRWWNVIEVGLKGPALFSHAVLNAGGMLERKTGIIISIGSDAGLQTTAGNTSYNIAKTGLLKFHQNLECELSRFGIINYYVHPGFVKGTTLTNALTEGPASFLEEVQATPLRKMFFQMFLNGGVPDQSIDLGADTCVALAADADAAVLSGTYIDAKDDLGQLIQAGKNGKYDGSIYTLGMKTLDGYTESMLEKQLTRQMSAQQPGSN